MSTQLRPITENEPIPSAEGMVFGIVVSEWNPEITNALLDGAYNTLINNGALPENVIVKKVPGTFELTLGGQFLAEYDDVDAVICLGCVIRGETPHFEYICQGVTYGITKLNMEYNLPFVFGVLTTDNQEQARERAGGKLGNKGEEAAIVAIKMANLQLEMEEE
jgi:6,7-dimethyl-8-ribityllumazine synthase